MAYAAGLGIEGSMERHLLTLIRGKQYASGIAVIVTNDYKCRPVPECHPLEGTYADFVCMEEAFTELNFAIFPVQNNCSAVLTTTMRTVALFKHYPQSYELFASSSLDTGRMTVRSLCRTERNYISKN